MIGLHVCAVRRKPSVRPESIGKIQRTVIGLSITNYKSQTLFRIGAIEQLCHGENAGLRSPSVHSAKSFEEIHTAALIFLYLNIPFNFSESKPAMRNCTKTFRNNKLSRKTRLPLKGNSSDCHKAETSDKRKQNTRQNIRFGNVWHRSPSTNWNSRNQLNHAMMVCQGKNSSSEFRWFAPRPRKRHQTVKNTFLMVNSSKTHLIVKNSPL